MSAVCPACGVAVVPGYVKCPKCHAGLPYGSGARRRTTIDPGGTAMKESGFPVLAVVVAIAAALAIVLFFGLRGGKKAADEPATPDQPATTAQQSTATQTQTIDTPQPVQTGPSPSAVAAELEHSLQRARLWSTIEINGARIDVRSGLCGDPGMSPALDGATAALRSAGLTRLRCVAQSGAVVFERDL